jgi:hypothetical protein
MPPLPFSPVGFSALIERVLALDSRHRLPSVIPKPLKSDILFSLCFFHFLRYLSSTRPLRFTLDHCPEELDAPDVQGHVAGGDEEPLGNSIFPWNS